MDSRNNLPVVCAVIGLPLGTALGLVFTGSVNVVAILLGAALGAAIGYAMQSRRGGGS